MEIYLAVLLAILTAWLIKYTVVYVIPLLYKAWKLYRLQNGENPEQGSVWEQTREKAQYEDTVGPRTAQAKLPRDHITRTMP